MTVRFFTKGDNTVPSARYRAFLVADALAQKYGVSVAIHTPHDMGVASGVRGVRSIFTLLRLFRSFPRKDVFIIQRAIYNKYLVLAFTIEHAVFRRRIIFDIDDAVFVHSSMKTRLLIRISDIVLCGGRAVHAWVRSRHAKTYYLPTSLPFEQYARHTKKHEKTSSPVIGWIGSGPAHVDNLRIVMPVLERLKRERISFIFRLIGAVGDRRLYDLCAPLGGQAEIVDEIDWTDMDNTAREISRFDIGIMPLHDDAWNRSKYFKTLEYMAVGVPAVVSNVGENVMIIQQRENGMLAATSDEWYDALTALLADASLRMKIGAAGQRTVRDSFSLTHIAEALHDILIRNAYLS